MVFWLCKKPSSGGRGQVTELARWLPRRVQSEDFPVHLLRGSCPLANSLDQGHEAHVRRDRVSRAGVAAHEPIHVGPPEAHFDARARDGALTSGTTSPLPPLRFRRRCRGWQVEEESDE